MKTAIIVGVSILIAGIILTLSLPRRPNASVQATPSYIIDSKSLSKPYLMNSLLLTSPLPKEAKFTLRVGLYSEISQAIDKAQTINDSEPISIVKAIDRQKEWYFLLMGPYSTRLKAEQKKHDLQKKRISSTLSLWPKEADTQ
ncbi:SPOR domain-containing protein [Marinomonas aquiplantarum]|uniref:SPOR domain-containing protein n=1 Tax=Marinomonas aquiplantarum TaxID=491951 RepID=A0A366CVQ6_9GAMM|nr:SPOR domain-containing protein [Marinomonas aquiplantarum]RBO81917.1 hypothetical protein DFP76_10760 [Marinomonas aquiplantarum]